MVCTDNGLVFAGVQRHRRDVFFAFEFGVESDGRIIYAFHEIIGNVLQQHLVQIQFDERVFFPESRDDGKQRLDIRHGRIFDRQGFPLIGLEIAHFLLHALLLLPQHQRFLVEKLAGFRRLDWRLFSVDQPDLERLLQ